MGWFIVAAVLFIASKAGFCNKPGCLNPDLTFGLADCPGGGTNQFQAFWSGFPSSIFSSFIGFFLPPVAVIVMTSAILLPVITTLGFDPYWFAIVFTINMEIGLITPPVGLNLYIIKGITPDVSLSEILKGSIPFMIIMALAIVILCIFPEIVTWLPDKIMGKDLGF